MAGEISSPNMLMPVPGVIITDGPQWATDINSCLGIIDQHDHATGQGVPVTPAGLNINSDLTFVNNNATNLRSLRLTPQSAPLALASDVGCLYESGVDLYYNDGSGTHVRLTQSGAVAGTPGSISNLVSPASASYSAGSSTFVWQSAANTPASMDAGSYILRNITANSQGLTLSPPNAMGSSYTIVLPSLPAQRNLLTIDASGNMSSSWAVDGVSLEVSSNLLQIKNQGVTQAKLATKPVTTDGTDPGVGGISISPDSGILYSNATTTATQITNCSCVLTTAGRPVRVALRSGSPGANQGGLVRAQNGTGIVIIKRDTTIISQQEFGPNTVMVFSVPPSSFWTDDITAPAGTYTYSAWMQVSNAASVQAFFVELVAYEI